MPARCRRPRPPSGCRAPFRRRTGGRPLPRAGSAGSAAGFASSAVPRSGHDHRRLQPRLGLPVFPPKRCRSPVRPQVGNRSSCRGSIRRLAVGCRLFGWLGGRRHHTRKHEAAQRAEFAFDQADAALLARNDDEQRDDGGKADQALKHGGSPKPGQLSLTNAAARRPVPEAFNALPEWAAGKIEHVSLANASGLQPLSLTHRVEKARNGLTARLPAAGCQMLVVSSAARGKSDGDCRCRIEVRAC